MWKLKKNKILTTSVTMVVFVILGVAVYMLFNIQMAGKNMTSLYNDRVLPLQQIGIVSDAYSKDLRCVQKAIDGVISPDSAYSALGLNSKQIELNWESYLKTYLTSDEKKIVQRAVILKSDADAFFAGISRIFKKVDGTSNDSLLQQVDVNRLYQKTELLETYLNELSNLQTKESGKLKSLTEDIFKKTSYLVLFIGVMCILVFWLIVYKHRLEQIVTDQSQNLKKQNDELNKAYEELQAVNEELDVSNEELYTTNEELATVNEQLQNSNQQLEQHTSGLEELVLERTHALAESEKNYRYIIDHSPLGIFQRTLEGKYIFSNQTLFHIFGCESKEEFLSHYNEISKRWYEPDKMNQFQNMLVEKKEVNGFEAKTQLVDGSFKWFLISARFETETSLVNGFVLDITQEKLKEIAIRETEAKIRAIFDLSYGFIGLLTPEGNLVQANRTSLEFVGTSLGDVHDKPFWETPWWNYSSEVQELIRNAINKAASGEMVRFEISHPGKNGNNVIVDFSIKPVMDENGKIIWLIPEGRDITERKLTEAALRENEERYRLITMLSGYVVYEYSADEKFIKWVGAVNQVTGYSLQEFAEIDFERYSKMMHPEDFDDSFKQFRNAIESKSSFHAEYRFLTKNEGYKWIENECFAFFGENGKVQKAIGVMKDVTHKKNMERLILNSVIETEERERMNFSQELHDGLGPLLSAAKMYIQLLGKQNEKVVRHEIMNDVEKLLEESSKTVREISFKLSPHILQNYGLLEAIKAYTEKIKETSTIEFKIEYNGLIRFNDKIEIVMYRVLCECITNTVKHSGADRISIKLNYCGDILIVDYHDNGKGFDIAKAQSGFSGIGLLNMQSRIRSINGTMTLARMPEEGISINFKIIISAN